jgi:uncharacterized membrane protein YcjF (UPF0283 family)
MYLKVKVDKVLFLPPQSVVVEPDQLYGQDLGQLDNVKLFPALSTTFAFGARVRNHFGLEEVLDAMLQGELARMSSRQGQGKLEEGLVLDRGPVAGLAG